MNYTEIKEKYPKAFEALNNWIPDYKGVTPHQSDCFVDDDGVLIMRLVDNGRVLDHEKFNDRDLYDFFDENRIRIWAVPSYLPGKVWCSFCIILNGMDLNADDFGDYPTRSEAESAAFVKAFEILEEKL